MVYVNKNSALETLQGLVEQSFNKTQNYMPDRFSEKQQEALELFKQRIFLEEVVEESISFNRGLNWIDDNSNIKLTTSAEELIEVYKLRSDVYTQIGYQGEFPDTIEGLNFDIHDKTSAIVYYKRDNQVSATCRLIFDSENGLPSEGKVSFESERNKYTRIGEISRNIVKHDTGGLNLEFKYLMASMHNVFMENDLGMTFSGIRRDHLKLFKKFGGVDVYKEMEGYGKLDTPFLIITWNPEEISPFFKRAFLNKR